MDAKLLLIDDDVAGCEAVATTLGQRGWRVVSAHTGAAAMVALEREEFDAVVSDINMPGMSGLELCRRARSSWPLLPVVLVTAFGTMESAVAAIRAGAYDFISKPIQIPELLMTLARAIEHKQLQEENKQLRDTVARQRPSAEMIGESAAIQAVRSTIRRIAGSDVTVLITGESGTGKELVAQAVHRDSPHANGPLVAINCAAVPETMLESELFGHVRGAFTDARTNRKGLFAQAQGGTLFLDEIGEMPLYTQVKLLRALQERAVRPVGSDRDVPFDARVVSATSRDLTADVAEHRFREDLYYRINVVHVQVPPLRARGNDILLIAEHFIRRFTPHSRTPVPAIDAATAEKLLTYNWPGNIRELQNCMERAVALTRADCITPQDLPVHIAECHGANLVVPPEDPVEFLPMDEIERRYVLRVLHAVNGSKVQAALSLGIDRRTLHRKLKAYGVS